MIDDLLAYLRASPTPFHAVDQARRRLEAHGFVTLSVPAAELDKAEGGVTCGSLVFPVPSQH